MEHDASMTNRGEVRLKVFISIAHRDSLLADRLVEHWRHGLERIDRKNGQSTQLRETAASIISVEMGDFM